MSDDSHIAAYDAFAWFYNRYWGEQWLKRVMPILDQLVLQSTPPPARILDLCCGTGHVAAVLTDRGYQVTGVDSSSEMLSYARTNAPKAEFIRADARDFDLLPQFDLALSLYDSLNHILDLGELTKAFTKVRRALLPRGRFLFDLNHEDGYIAGWKQAWPLVAEDHLLAAQPSYDQPSKTARMIATMFRLHDGQWVRTAATFVQRAYTNDEVFGALSEAGFADIAIHRPEVEFGWKGGGRNFFLARRP